MDKIAIIPARSGSKGLKDKNIIDLCGKPLINYTIEAALNSKLFDHVIVSTDSKTYGNISKTCGAKVVYRGEKASGDNASTYDVVDDFFKSTNYICDYFCLLQPTSPLRTTNYIIDSIKLFEKHYNQYDFLVSVCKAKHPSMLIKPLSKDNSMEYFNIDYSNYFRQNNVEYYPNGAMFFAKPEKYKIQKHFFGPRSIGFVMDELHSVDIDDEFDYLFAQYCMKTLKDKQNV